MRGAKRDRTRYQFPNPHVPTIAIIIVGGAVTGAAILKAPIAVWALLGVVTGLALLPAHSFVWVGAAVLAATLSRLLVTTGLAHGIVNFFHFPLALGAALVAATRGKPHAPLARSIAIVLAALLSVSFFSWLINGGELLRPLLGWLVFSEPLLIIYAVIKTPFSAGKTKLLWKLALLISIAQFPPALWQAASVALGDPVQGTFIGTGAGAHLAGAVALIGTLICVAKGFSAPTIKTKASWLIGGVLLFIVSVLADAKQAIIAFLPALVLVVLASAPIRLSSALIGFPILASVVLGSFSYYQPFLMAIDWTMIGRGALGKAQAFAVIAGKMEGGLGGWILGLGPGNSVSRVALMGIYVKPDSPVYLLGLAPPPVTQELWALTFSNWLFASSSVWSGISSWLGLFGDLGLAGIGLYIFIFWKLWKSLAGHRRWKTTLAKAVMIMAAVLGLMYSWLEEPGFTLLVALLVGLGLVSQQETEAPVHASEAAL
jgi:hypothetical protein